MNNGVKKIVKKWILETLYNHKDKYRYIVRGVDSDILAFSQKPVKKYDDGLESYVWGTQNNDGACEFVGCVTSLLYGVVEEVLNISWDDEEPLDITKELGIVDWENVPVDTKVFVSDDGEKWERRYFKRYNKLFRENNEEYPYSCFRVGCTSWSSGEEYDEVGWKYCKLAEDGE